MIHSRDHRRMTALVRIACGVSLLGLGACDLFGTRDPIPPTAVEPIPEECRPETPVSARDVLRGLEDAFGCLTDGDAIYDELHAPDEEFEFVFPAHPDEAAFVETRGIVVAFETAMEALQEDQFEAELDFTDVTEQSVGDNLVFNEMTYRLTLTNPAQTVEFGGVVTLTLRASDFIITKWEDSDDGTLEALGSFFTHGVGGRTARMSNP